MEALISYLPAIACGAIMLLICIPMMRNMHKGRDDSASGAETRQEIEELREEITRLRAEKTLGSDEERVGG